MRRLKTAFFKFSAQPPLRLLGTVAALSLAVCLAFPSAAMAWDAKEAVMGILDFFKLLIVLAAAVVAVLMVFRSQIIPAVVVVIAAAFLYVVLTPEIMSSIGEGIKALLKLSGGGSAQ